MAKSKRKSGVAQQEFEAAVPLDSLQPHPRNVNEGDLGAIIESIDKNGWFGAVLAQKSTGNILAGKHRWIAARDRGMEAVPVLWIDVDDATALRIMLADNRTARLGHDDPMGLSVLLQEIQSEYGSLAGTGFDGDDLDEMLADLTSAQLEQMPGQDESGRLKDQFQVLVTCGSESQQASLLDRLSGEGYNCRALIS